MNTSVIFVNTPKKLDVEFHTISLTAIHRDLRFFYSAAQPCEGIRAVLARFDIPVFSALPMER